MAGVDNAGYQANPADAADEKDVKVRIEEPRSVQPKKKDNSLLFTCGVLVLLILVAAVVILGIGIYTHGFGTWDNQDISDRGVMPLPTPAPLKCTTVGCSRAAVILADNMDKSADPCDDFYQFACGGYEKNRVLTPGTSSINPFQDVDNDLKIKMKAVLEGKSDLDNLNVVKQAKTLYKSCMNESEIERLGVQPLKDVITAKGGWSILGNWNDTDFDLGRYMAKVSLRSGGFVSWFVSPNPLNSTQNILGFSQRGITLGDPTFYLGKSNETYKAALKTAVLNIGSSLGGNVTSMASKVDKLIEFETELAKIYIPSAKRLDTNNSAVLTMAELTQLLTFINPLEVANLVLADAGIQLNNESLVRVYDVPFFKNLNNVIQKTLPETLAGSIVWSEILSDLKYLDKATNDQMNDLAKLLTGTVSQQPRYVTCTGIVNGFFGNGLARLYVNEHFKEGTDDIEDMTRHLLKVFKERLDDQDWLDEESRKKAEEKVDAMATLLGYPHFIMNNTLLNADRNITGLNADTYFENAMKVVFADTLRGQKALLKPVERTAWPSAPLVVNAFYSPPQNVIVFPLGILQPPFYYIAGPKMMNYGLIGSVIGHEVTHGFDTNGARYDKNGNMIRWMTLESLERFGNKTKCIENDYSSITIKQLGTKVNGKLTLTENIADLGGIKQAFQAYKDWVKENGEEGSLPGLSYTNEQLFFLSISQGWCQLTTDQNLQILSMSDTHTPSRERLFGILKNTADFADAFNCPLGSRMNPRDKCSVW